MHTILIQPLLCSPLAYGPVLDSVWSYGAVSLADTRSDETMAAMATRLLQEAPEEFALLGTSMGGYVALEVMRQEPERVKALALVSTSARADTPEQADARRRQSQLVQDGHFEALVDAAFVCAAYCSAHARRSSAPLRRQKSPKVSSARRAVLK